MKLNLESIVKSFALILAFSSTIKAENKTLNLNEKKDIVYKAVLEHLEPIYNPCILSRSVPPENYSLIVKRVLEDVADKIGNNDGFPSDEEISMALQLTLLNANRLNEAYCHNKKGPTFETTENFKIVTELYKKYKDKGPIIPWTIEVYLKLRYGI